jgi:TPR repeat protein
MKKTLLALTASLAFGITGAGYYFYQGDGVESLPSSDITAIDKQDSLIDLHKLANENVPKAMGKLAQEFYDGVNIKRNDEKAFYWASKGHELKDEVATFILARMYYYGEGTKPDVKKAIELLDGIKDKKLEVRYILGKMYLAQAKNDANYLVKGVVEIKAAADSGLPQAQLDMANTLRMAALNDSSQGLDEKGLLKQSAEYLAMAAAQGYTPAMSQLGLYFYNGIGVPKSKEKGMNLLKEAADNGDTNSAEILEKKNFDINEVSHG